MASDEFGEHARLNGKWLQIHCNEDGVDNPDADKGLGSVSEFRNGLFVVRSPDGVSLLEGSYTINPATNPPEIDWTDTVGVDAGKTFLSIYLLTENTFDFCAADDGVVRPTSFAPGIGLTIRRFTRAKYSQ